MPAQSKKQLALAHVLAKRGVGWAQELVSAQHGVPAKNLPTYSKRKKS